ncbi:MAG: hypothetical protein K2I75_00770, partial [Clostridiales bacterium]|nr:hypothetical protein [Clostridiales bacterium]
YNAICDELGSPLYVHSYYGYVWENGGEFLAYNEIEEGYDYGLINFSVFNKLPRGKKLTYSDYMQTVDTIGQIFINNNLTPLGHIHYHNNRFYFAAENDKTQCILSIKNYSLFFYCSQKEVIENGIIRMKPRYMRQKKLTNDDLDTLKREVESCFVAE